MTQRKEKLRHRARPLRLEKKMCSLREERLVRVKLPMQNFESGKFILKPWKSFSNFPS